ncbi:MAG TPA: hypothetical protein VFG30_21205 [Polyangiales bacterium]|nr:hypothetical protein [Polyangiales bacterium]
MVTLRHRAGSRRTEGAEQLSEAPSAWGGASGFHAAIDQTTCTNTGPPVRVVVLVVVVVVRTRARISAGYSS